MSELAAASAEDAFREAERRRIAARPPEALAVLGPLLEGAFGPLSPELTWRAMSSALKCLGVQGDWPALLRLADRAIAEFPGHPRGWRYAGEALHQLGDRENALDRLTRASSLAPSDIETRLLLRIVSDRSVPPPKPAVRPWPATTKAFADPREMIRRYLLRGRPDPKFLKPDSAFVTLGSCFARELAARIEAMGRRAHHEPIGEQVNSTFANRRLLDWLERGPVDPAGEAVEVAFGPHVRARLGAAIAEADVAILTLGVAPCFFHHATGELAIAPKDSQLTAMGHFSSHYVMRMTSVAENAENIIAIAGSLRRLAKKPVRIVLTVSPVALEGATEMASAVEADCLSKSTLRVACQEAMADPALSDVIYWPSFEMVRWLGAYWGQDGKPMTFGAEDGSTRHVSDWLVELIVEAFLDHFAAR